MIFLWVALAWAEPGRGATSAECIDCHETEHVEWLDSRHAVARTNLVFSASFDHFPHPWCLSCHEPEGQAEVGVGCISCHPEQSTSYEQVCARCHEFTFQLHTPRTPFALSDNPAQQTMSEWRSSSAAVEGTDCVACHMGSNGHSFPGAHTPELVRDLVSAKVVPLSPLLVRATVRAPGAAHRVPTGDPFRRIELRICADRSCDTVVAMTTLRRVIAHDETSWHLAEDRTIPPETPTSAAERVLDLPVNGAATWWRLDYRYGDRRFEPNLPEHAVGYLITEGPVESP